MLFRSLDRKELTVIRPLVLLEERAIAAAVRRCKIPTVKSLCPVDGDTARSRIKAEIRRLGGEYDRLRIKTLGALQRSGVSGWAPTGPRRRAGPVVSAAGEEEKA